MSNADLIEPPHEIICYALKVGDWFKERNITHWKIADCASRDDLELADKRIAELEKYGRWQDPLADRIAELERKLAVAREALQELAYAWKDGVDVTSGVYLDAVSALAQIGDK